MRSKTSKTVGATTVERWRRWLAEHHGSEAEVWLIFHKRHTGRASIAYEDAVDEALCFGWVDSLIKRLDEARYARKFTPRRADSAWSASNRTRYARLKREGRLEAAGLNRAPTDRRGDAPRPPRSKVPRYLREALARRPAVLATFERLAPSARRLYVAWIDSAKRDETKAKRMKKAIALLSAGEPLGLK